MKRPTNDEMTRAILHNMGLLWSAGHSLIDVATIHSGPALVGLDPIPSWEQLTRAEADVFCLLAGRPSAEITAAMRLITRARHL